MAFVTETDLRYPIGKFERPASLTDDQRRAYITHIEEAPAKMRAAVAGLNDQQLDTPYRPGGWTVRQLVHHVPDSHMNAYMRFKLALTEDNPRSSRTTKRPGPNLPTRNLLSPHPSIFSTHCTSAGSSSCVARAHRFRQREYLHPEHNRKMSLDQTLALYSWHGRHHVAHITALRERNSWR